MPAAISNGKTTKHDRAAESAIAGLREELRQKSEFESIIREELAHLRGHAAATVGELRPPLATGDGKASPSAKRTAATTTTTPNGSSQMGEAK